MAFDFQAYRNPYVSTIADLLSRGEDAKAKALVDTASAQARAAEIRGQAYGGAIDSVGKMVAGLPAQIQAGKDQAFKNEQEAQARLGFADKARERAELAKGKEAVGFLASLNQGPDPNYQRDPATGTSRYEGPPSPDYSGLFDQGDFGQKTFNPAKTRQALTAAGYGAYADQLMVNVGKQNQEVAQFVQGRNDTVAQAASHALAMLRAPKVDGSQTAWADAVNGAGAALVANDIYTQPQLDALIASGQDQGRQGQEQLLIGLMRKGSEKAVNLAPGETSTLYGQSIMRTPSNVKTTPADIQVEQYKAYEAAELKAGRTPVGIEEFGKTPAAGSEADFAATYAKEKFNKPYSALTVAEKAQTIGAFKAANQDQDARDASLAQKNLANALAAQQPTQSDADDLAKDLVANRLSPSQLKANFGTRGVQGQAFLLKVYSAARKVDPTFNSEEAESTYVLARSPGFQNTIRNMDAAVESIPRLLTNAQKLGNGNFRTLSALKSAAKTQFNDVDLAKFKTDALLVGDEVAKILSGGGSGSPTSDAKLKQAISLFKTSDSVPAIAATVEEVQALLANRRKALVRGTYLDKPDVKADSVTPKTAADFLKEAGYDAQR